MEEEKLIDALHALVRDQSDAELAEHAGDRGNLGSLARAELNERGHAVDYNDTNGVVVANVTLRGEDDVRNDSRDVVAEPRVEDSQTLVQQEEGVDDNRYLHPAEGDERPLDNTTVQGLVTSDLPITGEDEPDNGIPAEDPNAG